MQQMCRQCGTIVTANLVLLYHQGMMIADTSTCQRCRSVLWHWQMDKELTTFKGFPIKWDPPEPKKQLRLF